VEVPEVPAPEVLLCDSSYLVHLERSTKQTHAEKYKHWPRETIDRISAAVLAITPFTIAELRVGWERLPLGPKRLAAAETLLRSYVLIPLDERTLEEWVTLRVYCLETGSTLRDNDLWIAATAVSQRVPLVTTDRPQSELPGVDAIFLPVSPPAASA
jgi:predicted nucleic acid-binding protein